ncbi:MAG: hypothetical protein ABIQ40_14815 [Bacteroidia bacterium]
MKRLFFLYYLILFSIFNARAQENLAPIRFFSIGAGITYSSINSWQENAERKLNPGIQAKLSYQFNPNFNIEMASDFFFVHNSNPSFKNIHSWNQEINGNIVLPTNPQTGFRVSLGISYLDWKGYYTGSGLNGNTHYHAGEIIQDKYFQGNIGLGLTHKIGNRSFIDLGEVMRFSSTKNRVGLSDISLQLGYGFILQTPKNISKGKDNNKTKGKGIGKGKYKWLKKKRG